MSELAALIYSDLPGALPADYRIAPSESVRLSSVSARFDGAGALDAFRPCLSVLSQDGKLIGRFFPSQVMSPGDSGEVTFGPFLDDGAAGAPQYAALSGPAFIDVGAGVLEVPVTWESFDMTLPSWLATGDAATATIQNAPGDDAIFPLADGLYMFATLTQVATVPVPGLVDIAWRGDAAPLPVTAGISNDFGGTAPPVAAWTPLFARNAFGNPATPLPYAQLTLSNGGAAVCRFQFMQVVVGFVPGYVPPMTTVY